MIVCVEKTSVVDFIFFYIRIIFWGVKICKFIGSISLVAYRFDCDRW